MLKVTGKKEMDNPVLSWALLSFPSEQFHFMTASVSMGSIIISMLMILRSTTPALTSLLNFRLISNCQLDVPYVSSA